MKLSSNSSFTGSLLFRVDSVSITGVDSPWHPATEGNDEREEALRIGAGSCAALVH